MGAWADLWDYLAGTAVVTPTVVQTALTRREVLFRLSGQIDQTPGLLTARNGGTTGKPLRGYVGANGFKVDRHSGPKDARRLVVDGDVHETADGSAVTYTVAMAGGIAAEAVFVPLLLVVGLAFTAWLAVSGDGRALVAAIACFVGGSVWAVLLAYAVRQAKQDYLAFMALVDDLASRRAN